MTALPAEIIFQQLTRAFEASQDYPRDQIVKRQTALLERIVRHADMHSPFYRDSRRLKPLFRADGAFDMAGWGEIPILTRAEAKEHQDALWARQVPPDMGELETHSTSGSTGIPLRFRRTLVQKIASEVLLNRLLRWHGLWPIHRFAVPGATAPEPLGPGLLKLPGVRDWAKHIQMMRQDRTTHVLAPSSIASAWADLASPGDLPDLTTVVATGEVLRAEVRAKIERRLRVKVLNLYGASELGPIASEGPDGRLRINEETVHFEAPDAPTQAKTPTRVVVTPFYAFGMPLIRYAPGDYVHFSRAKVAHARGLRRLDEVIGRQRNLLRRPDGSLFIPGYIVARRLEAIVDCREWQLVQTSLSEIMLRIVVARPPNAQQMAALETYVQSALPEHATRVEIVDRIENNVSSGKAYDMFLSLID